MEKIVGFEKIFKIIHLCDGYLFFIYFLNEVLV